MNTSLNETTTRTLWTDGRFRNRLLIRVPAVPVAQPRARATTVNGQARMYEAKKTHAIHAFKASVRLAASQAYQGQPISGEVVLNATFVMHRPSAMFWKTRPMPRVPHTKKPDRDNLDKAVLDALKGTLLADDCCVWDGRITKWIAAGNEQPHVEVEVIW